MVALDSGKLAARESAASDWADRYKLAARESVASDLADRYIKEFRPGLQDSILKMFLTAIAVVDADFFQVDPTVRDEAESVSGVVDRPAGDDLSGLMRSLLQIGYERDDLDVVAANGDVVRDSYLYRVLDPLYEGEEGVGPLVKKYARWHKAFNGVLGSRRYWYDVGIPTRARCLFPYRPRNNHPFQSPQEREGRTYSSVDAEREVEEHVDARSVEHVISYRPSASLSLTVAAPVEPSTALEGAFPDTRDGERQGDAPNVREALGGPLAMEQPDVVVGVEAGKLRAAVIRSLNEGLPIVIRELCVIGDLDLSGLSLPGRIRFEDCYFYKTPSVEKARSVSRPENDAATQASSAPQGVARADVILDETRGTSFAMERCVLGHLKAMGLGLSGSLLLDECDVRTITLNRAVVKGHVTLRATGALAFGQRLSPADHLQVLDAKSPDDREPADSPDDREPADSPDDREPADLWAMSLKAGSVIIEGGHFARVRLIESRIDHSLQIGSRDHPVRISKWGSVVRAHVEYLILNYVDIGPGDETSGFWAFGARLGSVSIDSGCRFWGTVDFSGANVAGALAVKARVLDNSGAPAVPSLNLGLARVAGAVTLGLVADPLDESDESKIAEGYLSAPRSGHRASWVGEVSLRGARIDGDLMVGHIVLKGREVITGSSTSGPPSIDATGIKVSGKLALEALDTSARVVADGARADVLTISDCKLAKETATSPSRRAFGPIVGDLVAPGLSLRSAVIGLRAELTNSSVRGDLSLAQAAIRDLLLGCDGRGGSSSQLTLVDGVLHATGLTVSGDCRLHACFVSKTQPGEQTSQARGSSNDSLRRPPRDGEAPFTRLTNARLGNVEFGPGYGNEGSGLVCLVGSQFGELRRSSLDGEPSEEDSVVGRLRRCWRSMSTRFAVKPDVPQEPTKSARYLEEEQQIEFTLRLISHYSMRHFHPSPYVIAASTQKSLGREAAARDLHILQKRDELKYGEMRRSSRVGSQASSRLTRYGYSFAPLWGLLAVLVGAALTTVLATSWLGLFIPTQLQSGSAGSVGIFSECSATYPCFNWFVYLLDTIVPVANFQQADFWQPVGWWMPTALGVFTVAIWGLSIFLIAAVSNHAKKSG